MKKLFLYIDGAARGNPGPAGAGILINDEKGNMVDELSSYLGEVTNNVAEYSALILGMQHVREKGCKELVINTDSQLLAKQLGGEYKVKSSGLKDLYKKVNDMLHSFDEVRINQIPREENKIADKLANEAIDNAFKKKKQGTSFILKTKKTDLNTLF